ncbi:MAG: pvdYII, partial [Actinoallomurus sp.]|nr:pvdYII [Actinoallomurus sp.]
MSNLNDLSTLALPSGSVLGADETQTRLSLSLEGQPLITLRLKREPELQLQVEERFSRPAGQAFWAACYWLFA